MNLVGFWPVYLQSLRKWSVYNWRRVSISTFARLQHSYFSLLLVRVRHCNVEWIICWAFPHISSFCCFRALAYTTLDKLLSVFVKYELVLNLSSFVCHCPVWSRWDTNSCSCLVSCHTVDDSSQDHIHQCLIHHRHRQRCCYQRIHLHMTHTYM